MGKTGDREERSQSVEAQVGRLKTERGESVRGGSDGED